MKFYTALVGDRKVLHHRKDDAKADDKNFQQIDIPTDMAGLKTFVQELYDKIAELDRAGWAQKIVEIGPDRVEVAPPTGGPGHSMPAVEDRGFPATPAPITLSPEAAAVAYPEDDEPDFDAAVLESQVSLLGEMGITALERFDGWTARTGIGAAFHRGVSLLNVICSDEHQLARLFLRQRAQERKAMR